MAFEKNVELLTVTFGGETWPAVRVTRSETLGSEIHALNGSPLDAQRPLSETQDGGLKMVVVYF